MTTELLGRYKQKQQYNVKKYNTHTQNKLINKN